MKLYSLLILNYYHGFNIREHLSTKSPYPEFNIKTKDSSIETIGYLNGCKVKQILHVNRHGTRFPSSKDITKFNQLSAKVKTIAMDKLSAKDQELFNWINSYNINFNLEDNELLTDSGESELYQLGKRMSNLHPALFKSTKYKPYLFPFGSSIQSRSAISGTAYSLGLFENRGNLTKSKLVPVYLETFAKGEDPYLEIKKSCPKWLLDIDGGKAAMNQTAPFIKANYPKHLDTLRKRFGIEFSLEEFKSIYKSCGYDISIFGNENRWCRFLDRDMVLDLEFENDLDDYFTYSYGSGLNSYMATELMSKLFNYTKLIYEHPQSGEKAPRGVFMFGHSETIQFLVTFLDLFRDKVPLRWDMGRPERDGREYRTSKIAPFASNLDFEIYSCKQHSESEASNRQVQFKGSELEELFIQVKLNENAIINPSCNDKLCSLTKFLNYYEQKLSQNFENLCKL
ncbi:phosphoglycerate mutase-like protein [Conidiobolus coronatus NRRL 28638]|uniref:Multiple inositol polyphosphate phosphatase 1 n=1 Tax=Conidiobolus coronatus (strain ATCC 28846 / CBS 209.66 / NRRL 28638) TaxID=796925 RepID=A0A137P9R2_CONC2|nr:phosphoglycerate mutase-like protein [Conidiobolus coronatus NRRL 28638]|eukprot:KXN71746.1 phosphoglycerate mutase-like protein [Conidiobolus coronatus NRRL 28638]